MQEGANFKESGQTKFGGWEGAVGIERPHVDGEGSFVEAFGFKKYLGIRESWMDSNQASREEGVKHGLNTRAIGGFLRRGAGIG